MLRHRCLQVALGLWLAGCGPDCTKAVQQLSVCTEETEAARKTFITRAQIDCDSGETPTYYDCWAKVDGSNCQNAVLICQQYADR